MKESNKNEEDLSKGSIEDDIDNNEDFNKEKI